MQSVIVLGGSGLVGSHLAELWAQRFDVRAPAHDELDVLDERALAEFVDNVRPDAIVNAAAWADVDAAEVQRGDERGLVYQLNTTFPRRLAELCAAHGTFLVHLSTDYIFDGTSDQRPYREDDPPGPLSWYAQTKAVGEELVRQSHRGACIVRVEMPFTARPHRKRDFARTCVSRLRAGQEIVGVTDQRITPVFLDDAVEALARVVEQRPTGILHVAASTWTTPYDFARAIASAIGLPLELVRAEPFERFGARRAARRPQHSWLDVSLARSIVGRALRGVDEQLEVWAAQLVVVPSQARPVR